MNECVSRILEKLKEASRRLEEEKESMKERRKRNDELREEVEKENVELRNRIESFGFMEEGKLSHCNVVNLSEKVSTVCYLLFV